MIGSSYNSGDLVARALVCGIECIPSSNHALCFDFFFFTNFFLSLALPFFGSNETSDSRL